ncbi:hypothetical protein [Pseudooctadecabacter jejudonensis]|uniref:Uncharacterized protein n=1 Tax=Pseudooctadecabacter jejudonensis TaxID=1391910 RepID=A0A1Y5RW65_9RHOB|nr:hypothetical protein [Pseudooctadecabacter jejudonensis]SLN26962.1 hypothetical protein PSJ8397_01103 [Pseudooctadecabacter jejudonensis]
MTEGDAAKPSAPRWRKGTPRPKLSLFAAVVCALAAGMWVADGSMTAALLLGLAAALNGWQAYKGWGVQTK